MMSTAKKMKKKMATKADWSGLDDLALEDITGRMTLYQDFAALRMVCTSWRSSLQDFKFKFCRMPWLMIPPKYGTYLREFFIFPHVEEQVLQGGMITQQHLVLPDPDPETRILSHLSSKGWLISIDRRSLGDNPTMTQVANMPEVLVQEMSRAYAFIVESSRRLLVVTQRELNMRRGRRGRRSRKTNYGTFEFLIFDVDLSTNNWTVMKDLGNQTLFLGGNSSICMESDGVYFKPNRIYFTDYYMDAASFFKESGGQHVRVYNIEDGRIDPYFLGDSCDRLTPSNNLSTPPIFVEQ